MEIKQKNLRFQIIQTSIPLYNQSTKWAAERQDSKRTIRNITQEEAGKAALCQWPVSQAWHTP